MRPTKRDQGGQQDLLRSRLDQTVDLAHPLAKLARGIDWSFLEQRLGAVYTDGPGRPLRIPTKPATCSGLSRSLCGGVAGT
jgi:transposase, IS5 family